MPATAKTYPLLIFDWDGTLVDSIERIVTSLQFASKSTVGSDISETQARDVIGLGLVEAVARLHPDLDTEKHHRQLQQVADAYRQHYLFDNKVPAPLFDGVKELLDSLRQQGYLLAISTGKSRHGLEQSLTQHNVVGYFETTRCAGENRSKPHPEMLQEILEELNYTPTDAIMIGDSEHDLQMANNAGMASIGITHGVHDAETLQQFQPIACLENIAELSEFLSHNTI